MKTLSIDDPRFLERSTRPTMLDRLARRIVRDKLGALDQGCVVLHERGETAVFGNSDDENGLTVSVTVNSPAFYSDIAFGGLVGSGEAYINGYWDCDEVDTLVRIILQNREVMETMDAGVAVLLTPVKKLFHWLNRNTRAGSRRNIAAHYDLGNDFYALWLDPEMMYSCAYYPEPNSGLDEAAVAKLDRICRKLNLKPDDSVVEIGTGWGGFAIHAAQNYGCHVTTTTISTEQYEYARARIINEGLEDRITLLKNDYRDLEGHYDKLVSIEMIEAVGHEYLDTFFETCAALLKPDGEMLLQSITILDQRYEKAKKTVDFIKRYVFPGGFLPSNTAINNSMTRVTDLRAIHMEDIGLHYAKTLSDWRERFFAHIAEVRQQGYTEEFIRLWEFYLCYCEAAFTERSIGNVQLHAIKPDARPLMHTAL
ncbi:MAG: cyclopropane-fatty-acyl-phospholipid synthase family protein [Pseudomonadota bacterium]